MLYTKEKPSSTRPPCRETANVGERIVVSSPPTLAKPRSADILKSDLIPIGKSHNEVLELAKQEAVRVLGGKAGEYHTAEAVRRYPYGKSCVSFGGLKSHVVPRLYFSRPIARNPANGLAPSQLERYDYDARFPLGYGPMAMDEDNRIIHGWSVEMEKMADQIWRGMRRDK